MRIRQGKEERQRTLLKDYEARAEVGNQYRHRRWAALLLATSVALPATVVVHPPANAGAGPAGVMGNVTPLANMEWTERKAGQVIRWYLDARQMSLVTPSVGMTGTYTAVYLSSCRRSVGQKEWKCPGDSWEVDATDFMFDPLLRKVEVTLPSGKTLTWIGKGPLKNEQSGTTRPPEGPSGPNLAFVSAESEQIATVYRSAKVRGHIEGIDLGAVGNARSHIILWVGAWARVRP